MSGEMARGGLRAPVNVTWEVTLECNLRCVHCLSDAGAPAGDEMDTGECKSFLDQLSSLKVFQVNIGGGEPFMRPDFLDLLNHAHDKGVVTCVSTNGTFIDRALAKALSRMPALYLQVSLDGATAEVNDRIRGPGTFEKILTGLDRLASEGVAFSINTVLTHANFPQLDILRGLARDYGADLRVSRFRPSGRGKASRAALGPSKRELESFADWLHKHDLVRTGDSFFCLTSENRRSKGLDMCGAAKMTCCVSPEGDLYPCAFLQETAFCAGNVKEKGVKEMWDHARVFRKLRGLDVESCHDCLRFEQCRGGCPAMAYHTYHDLSLPDPECLVNLKGLPELRLTA